MIAPAVLHDRRWNVAPADRSPRPFTSIPAGEDQEGSKCVTHRMIDCAPSEPVSVRPDRALSRRMATEPRRLAGAAMFRGSRHLSLACTRKSCVDEEAAGAQHAIDHDPGVATRVASSAHRG